MIRWTPTFFVIVAKNIKSSSVPNIALKRLEKGPKYGLIWNNLVRNKNLVNRESCPPKHGS